MFKAAFCACVSLTAVGSVFAQGSTTAADFAESPASFIVQLTEYRLEQPLDPSQPAAAILEMLSTQRDGEKPVPVETIRLSTLSGIESMVQFGHQVNVTSGTTTTNRGTFRNLQSIDVGTLVRITAAPRNGKVEVSLTFESSRVGREVDKDSPPNISKTQLTTTQLLELGKPSLVGSSTTESSSIIVVTITKS